MLLLSGSHIEYVYLHQKFSISKGSVRFNGLDINALETISSFSLQHVREHATKRIYGSQSCPIDI